MGDHILSPKHWTLFLIAAVSASLGMAKTAFSQESGPTSGAAASVGMTTGLPGGSSANGRQMDMMQVRASARESQYQAAAAQMARSADSAIEENNRETALQDARETKKLKKDAITRMKWERSANAYNKISADQMSTWKDRAGNVRVERNVPNEFLLALRQEEAAMAEEDGRKEKGKLGFHPLRATRNALGTLPIPFRKNGEPASSESGIRNPDAKPLPEDNRRGGIGFMRNLHPPKLPFVGGNRNRKQSGTIAANSAPKPQVAAQAGAASSAAAPVTASVTVPGRVPEISGAALVDGRSPVGRGQTTKPSPNSGTVKKTGDDGADVRAAADTQMTQATSPGKKGFFALRKSSSGSSHRGGGFGFGFGKKKSKMGDRGTVDGSLFPSNSSGPLPGNGNAKPLSAPVASTGASVNASAGASTAAMQPAPVVDNVELPGSEPARKKKRKFSLPKPSIPALSKADSGGSGKKGKSPEHRTTTVNANGNSFYRVSSQAQFMKYGESQMESEISVLPPGVLVKMTKPGAEWATVQLDDGTKGVIQVKSLRDATASEVPSQFGITAAAAASDAAQ